MLKAMSDAPPHELLTHAETGDPEAQNTLARWYATHGGEPENLKAAEMWFRRAADQGLPRAKHNLGVLSLRTGNVDAAEPWFRSAAESGWLPSVFALGTIYEGAGELTAAVGAYKIAATRGHADSQDALGRLALNEKTPDYENARHWSELAAAQDNGNSQARLGTIYHEGLGVPRDSKTAMRWFLSAARLGHSGAQLAIGVAYERGLHGLEANIVESVYWLTVSAAQNNEGARACLETMQRERPLTEQEQAEVNARLRDAGINQIDSH